MATILVVDDHPTNCEFLVTLLGYAGHQLLQSGDGAEALEVARAEQPDLIIVDIVMPTMDGYEFVRQLRADPTITQTCVIFYTATYLEAEVHTLAQACGVHHSITKPVEPELVLKIVAEALAHVASPTLPLADEEFHREHLRVLTNKLSKQVETLEQEVAKRTRAEEALRRAYDEVEQRVQARTVALTATNAALQAAVHDRVQAERESRESKTRYHSLFEHSFDAIFLGTPDGQILAANPAACRLFGYTEAELQRIGRNALHDMTDPRFPAALEERGRTGKVRGELTLVRQDGSKFFAEVSSTIFQVREGVEQTAILVRDITVPKRAEEMLRQSEERFRRAFDDAAIGMALVAPDGRFLRVNQGLCAIVGYAEQELLATTFQAISHLEDLQLNLAYVHQLLAGEIATYQMEKRYIHKDGSLVWVLLSVSLVRDASGAPLYFVSQVVDITSRKQAEETLQESEERFRSLSAASPIGIFQNDADGKTVYVNPRWMEIAGRTLEESLGDEWMKGIPPGERESVLAAWKACARAGGEFSRQFRLVRPSGEVCWVHSRAAPFYANDGRLIGYVGTTEDITVRKQAEAAIARQAQELARSNVELQQFASVASHDLQEPLRKIQTFVDLVLTECAQTLTPQGWDYLQRIMQSAGRMRSLIKDLLTLSRVSTKGQPFAPVDLSRIAQEVKVDLEARIQDTGGGVEVDELPILEADPTQMRQLLQNLIGNALKFHRQEESPRVKVYCQNRPAAEPWLETGHCCIVVEDNGVGFDEKYLERIFQPFQRLHGHQEYEGTGMGLAICRKIVERHGGLLTAKSAPGRGATFVITLPLRQEPMTRRAA